MKKVFVIQPFGAEFQPAYEMVRQAVLEAGATPFRVDEVIGDGSVIEELYKAIESSAAIICDISKSNPNVMYELGYAHALKKPVILISKNLESIPFDVHGVRLLRYDLVSISGGNEFVHELGKTTVEALNNPEAFAQRPRTETRINSVFVSYSHRDQEFLRRLMVHLRPLEKQGVVELWADTKLMAGDSWKEEIERALGRSRIAILLISADFLASDFIIDNELPPLLEKAETKGTRIVPLILKPCRFIRDRKLARFHAINDPQLPLVRMSEADQEAAYDRVAEAVERSLVR